MIADEEILLPELLRIFSYYETSDIIRVLATYGCPPSKPTCEYNGCDKRIAGVKCWRQWLETEKERLTKLEHDEGKDND